MGEGEEVRGGNKRPVQVRKAVRGNFGAAGRQVFLDHLAPCCNVGRGGRIPSPRSVNFVNFRAATRRPEPVLGLTLA